MITYVCMHTCIIYGVFHPSKPNGTHYILPFVKYVQRVLHSFPVHLPDKFHVGADNVFDSYLSEIGRGERRGVGWGGLDGVTYDFVKKCKQSLSPIFTAIMNICARNRRVSAHWKMMS